MRKKALFLLILLFTLPFAMYMTQQVLKLWSKAAPKKANIVIDTKQKKGPLPPLWRAFAQGGEEPPPMLHSTIEKMQALKPRLIRLDHIYDAYTIVKRTSNGYEYDFSTLDKTVDDILACGALPFFSLSYMPIAFTSTGSVIDTPQNWDDWKNLVKATIQHYSGKSDKNLSGVYYEVWNEPELPQFGSFKLASPKDYRLLYFYASKASSETTRVNQFFLGGPAVGSYYPNWVRDFVLYVEQNNLRLDFYSWHRYHKNPDIFASDAFNIKSLLSQTNHQTIPLIISEWGMESENNTINNSNTAASFTIAAISSMLSNVSYAFTFEIKDGPPPAGGKWGLLTHEKDPNPLSPKSRYKVLSTLANMQGNTLNLSGEGTFVKGFASITDNTIQVILANYDTSNSNTEQVPVILTNLDPASYTLTTTYPLQDSSSTKELISTNGTIQQQFLLPANSVLFIELTPSGSLAQFIPGKSGLLKDTALVLSEKNKLIFTSPEFRLRPVGKMTFDIKPFWDIPVSDSLLIFDVPFSTESSSIQRFFLSKQKQECVFGVTNDNEEIVVKSPCIWEKNTWHHVELMWEPTHLDLTIDSYSNTLKTNIDLRNGQILTFYPINAAFDNLHITLGENQYITRQFDNRVDQ
jgi:hypothetical protein